MWKDEEMPLLHIVPHKLNTHSENSLLKLKKDILLVLSFSGDVLTVQINRSRAVQ
jgi:hypothetical protein